MQIGLHIILICFIFCFLKDEIILNVKVVPNDTFKFVGERVKCTNIPPTSTDTVLVIIKLT